MTTFSKNLGGPWPLWLSPGYAYGTALPLIWHCVPPEFWLALTTPVFSLFPLQVRLVDIYSR